MSKKAGPIIWAEFYTLADDVGITFPVIGVSLWGGHLRLHLPAHQDWVHVFESKEGEYKVNGVFWTDFGCSPEPWEGFTQHTRPEDFIEFQTGMNKGIS